MGWVKIYTHRAVVFIILLGFLFILRNPLFEFFISSLLSTAGFSDISVHISSLQPDHLKISSLSFFRPDNDIIKSVKLENMVLEFRLQDLLMRKLSNITIDFVEITLSEADKTASRNGFSNFSMPKIHFSKVPFLKQLEIRKLKILGEKYFLSGLEYFSFHAVAGDEKIICTLMQLISGKKRTFCGEVSFHIQENRQVAFECRMSSENGLVANVWYDRFELVLNGLLSASGTECSVELAKESLFKIWGAGGSIWKNQFASMDLQGTLIRNSQQWSFLPGAKNVFTSESLTAKDFSLGKIYGTFFFHLIWRENSFFVEFPNGYLVSGEGLVSGSLNIPEVKVTVLQQIEVELDRSEKKIEFLYPFLLQVNMDTVRHRSILIHQDPLFVTIEKFLVGKTGWNLQGGVSAEFLTVNREDLEIPLYKGNLNLQADLNWSDLKPLQLRAVTTVRDAHGHLAGNQIMGLDLDFDLALLPELRSLSAGHLFLKNLHCGVDVQNINADFFLKAIGGESLPVLTVEKASAEVFSGNISTNQFFYNFDSKHADIDMYFKALDLDEIVRAQKGETVNVTGKIDGHLPVQLEAEGVTISDGTFKSVPPGGVIQYKHSRSSKGSGKESLTGIVLKALEDFRYDILDGSAQYAKDGSLALRVHLEGVSPALETDRPVHLNLNMEQNILSLLKSLRYSRIVNKELDKKIKQQFK